MKTNSDIEKYIINHIDDEDEILKALDRETHLKVLGARMISGNWQGQILTMISKMVTPKSILEIGTFTGYSAICLAKGLAEYGKLITIETNDELKIIAEKYFHLSGLQNQIIQKNGSAIEIIPALNEKFDLVFIDADKREYCQYYNLVFEKLNPGAIIIADNTLWNGKVTQAVKPDDFQTKGILEFNELIKNDLRVEKVILPVRDGITLIRKK